MLSDDEKLELARGCEGHVEFADRIIAAHTAKLLADVEMPEYKYIDRHDVPKEGMCVYTQDQLQAYAAAVAAQARMKALEGSSEVLTAILNTLVNANEQGAITDTIWFSNYETLFDYIAAAIESLKGKQA